MDFLIITDNKKATSEEVFHPLIDTARSMGEKAWFYPMHSADGICSYEFQIGRFETDSLDLVVSIPMPGSIDEMKLVAADSSKFFDPATNDGFDLVRLALITCYNDELIFRFCKSYLNFKRDHKISYEARQDKVFDFEKMDKVKYQPYWYEKNEKIETTRWP